VIGAPTTAAILLVALVLFLGFLSGVLFVCNGLLMLLRLIRRTVLRRRLLLGMLLLLLAM